MLIFTHNIQEHGSEAAGLSWIDSKDGMHMQVNGSTVARVEELELELQQLISLVNTLLTVIAEEADGVQSGAAPTHPGIPPRGYSM